MNVTEAVVAVLVVGICVGLPVLGITLRFALKPALDAYSSLKQAQPRRNDEVEALRMRVAALEAVWERRLGAGNPDATPARPVVALERMRGFPEEESPEQPRTG